MPINDDHLHIANNKYIIDGEEMTDDVEVLKWDVANIGCDVGILDYVVEVS